MEENPPAPKPTGRLHKLAHLLRERWPEYVLEIIVIILSISISFALDEWKDGQRKGELEQLYLKELTRDMASDVGQLNEIIAETGQVVQTANELIKLSQQPAQPDYNQVIRDVRFIFKRPRFVAQDATFSDLKSTGNLQVIRNFELKSALFDYYKQYESIVLIETAELETTNSVVGPYILKRLPLGDEQKRVQPAILPAMLNETEFQNALLVRRSTRQELLQEYGQTLSQAKQILASLKAQRQ